MGFGKVIIVILLALSFQLKGQSDLTFYGDVMTNAFEADHRDIAVRKFNVLFSEFLNEKESFSKDLKFLKWVSVKYPEDHSFRIITWQVESQNETFNYFGYLQFADGRLISLKDESGQLEDPDYEVLGPSNWYGALYYNMVEKIVDGQKRYFLFGYNGATIDIQIKVIDELYFEDGEPYFGKESFVQSDGDERPTIKNRIIIEYSEKANVNSNFNVSMDMIVHDFVTPSFGISKTGRPVKIPDGTYVGYIWKNKTWNRVEKIANQISTPESIYYQPKEKADVDIFGKPAKKRN